MLLAGVSVESKYGSCLDAQDAESHREPMQ